MRVAQRLQVAVASCDAARAFVPGAAGLVREAQRLEVAAAGSRCADSAAALEAPIEAASCAHEFEGLHIASRRRAAGSLELPVARQLPIGLPQKPERLAALLALLAHVLGAPRAPRAPALAELRDGHALHCGRRAAKDLLEELLRQPRAKLLW